MICVAWCWLRNWISGSSSLLPLLSLTLRVQAFLRDSGLLSLLRPGTGSGRPRDGLGTHVASSPFLSLYVSLLPS